MFYLEEKDYIDMKILVPEIHPVLDSIPPREPRLPGASDNITLHVDTKQYDVFELGITDQIDYEKIIESTLPNTTNIFHFNNLISFNIEVHHESIPAVRVEGHFVLPLQNGSSNRGRFLKYFNLHFTSEDQHGSSCGMSILKCELTRSYCGAHNLEDPDELMAEHFRFKGDKALPWRRIEPRPRNGHAFHATGES